MRKINIIHEHLHFDTLCLSLCLLFMLIFMFLNRKHLSNCLELDLGTFSNNFLFERSDLECSSRKFTWFWDNLWANLSKNKLHLFELDNKLIREIIPEVNRLHNEGLLKFAILLEGQLHQYLLVRSQLTISSFTNAFTIIFLLFCSSNKLAFPCIKMPCFLIMITLLLLMISINIMNKKISFDCKYTGKWHWTIARLILSYPPCYRLLHLFKISNPGSLKCHI